MGSSLSSALANIFMGWFEIKVFENSIKKPKLWVKYVNDIFVIWQHEYEELNKFYEFVNNQMTSVTFTLQMEKERTSPFLDVLVKHSDTGIITEVYRKPAHSDYVETEIQTTLIVQTEGIIKTLQAGAKRIRSNEQGFKKEITNIVDIQLKMATASNISTRYWKRKVKLKKGRSECEG